MLSCISATSNKSERLMHLVGWCTDLQTLKKNYSLFDLLSRPFLPWALSPFRLTLTKEWQQLEERDIVAHNIDTADVSRKELKISVLNRPLLENLLVAYLQRRVFVWNIDKCVAVFELPQTWRINLVY